MEGEGLRGVGFRVEGGEWKVEEDGGLKWFQGFRLKFEC